MRTPPGSLAYMAGRDGVTARGSPSVADLAQDFRRIPPRCNMLVRKRKAPLTERLTYRRSGFSFRLVRFGEAMVQPFALYFKPPSRARARCMAHLGRGRVSDPSRSPRLKVSLGGKRTH